MSFKEAALSGWCDRDGGMFLPQVMHRNLQLQFARCVRHDRQLAVVIVQAVTHCRAFLDSFVRLVAALLYLQDIPVISTDVLEQWRELSYADLAVEVLHVRSCTCLHAVSTGHG